MGLSPGGWWCSPAGVIPVCSSRAWCPVAAAGSIPWQWCSLVVSWSWGTLAAALGASFPAFCIFLAIVSFLGSWGLGVLVWCLVLPLGDGLLDFPLVWEVSRLLVWRAPWGLGVLVRCLDFPLEDGGLLGLSSVSSSYAVSVCRFSLVLLLRCSFLLSLFLSLVFCDVFFLRVTFRTGVGSLSSLSQEVSVDSELSGTSDGPRVCANLHVFPRLYYVLELSQCLSLPLWLWICVHPRLFLLCLFRPGRGHNGC